jgi:hypothetical protein
VDWSGFTEIKRGMVCRRRACDAAHSRHDGVFTADGTHCSTRSYIYAHNKSTALAALSPDLLDRISPKGRTSVHAAVTNVCTVPNVAHMTLKCVR